MGEENDYRDALRLGMRKAAFHWLRAGYEVVAGVGALLQEVNDARKDEAGADDDEPGSDGPIRIEID